MQIIFQIQVPHKRSLCPSEGHYSFGDGNCSPTFVKCAKFESHIIEGTLYRCPRGFSYWNVSRRCERTEKIPNCGVSSIDSSNSIPIEWINLGKARKLRF